MEVDAKDGQLRMKRSKLTGMDYSCPFSSPLILKSIPTNFACNIFLFYKPLTVP